MLEQRPGGEVSGPLGQECSRNSQSKGSEVGRYLACSMAGRPVWLEGREQDRVEGGESRRARLGGRFVSCNETFGI